VLLLLHHGVYFLHGCCDGLLLLSQRGHIVAGNSWCTTPQLGNTPRYLPTSTAASGLTVAGFYFHAPTAEYRVLFYRCHRTRTMTRKQYNYSVAAVARPEVRRLPSTTGRGSSTG
jgi:hypothetical protein